MNLVRNIILAAVGAALFSGNAAAQSDYIGMFGGYNIPQDSDWTTGGVPSTAAFDKGMALGAFVGRELENGLRVEGEVSYRMSSIDTIATAKLDGQVTNTALMLNLIYEFGMGGGYSYGYAGSASVRPYLGLGGGGALVKFDDINDTTTTFFDDSTYAYAYQFIGGIGFEMTPDSIFSVDYRYFATDSVKFNDTSATAFEADFVDWTVTIGIRTKF